MESNNIFNINRFFKFLKDHKVLVGAFSYVLGKHFFKNVKKFTDEIIYPIASGNFDRLKKIKVEEYIKITIQTFIISYIIYIILSLID